MANKGFIKDWNGNQILPITRGELVLDQYGQEAFHSNDFLADITKKLPGLMTWEEKAMLSGGGAGGTLSLASLQQRVNYINQGFKVNDVSHNFYSEDASGNATATPINLKGTTQQITVGANGNEITIGLTQLQTEITSVNAILRSISVDQYGRVTAVTGSALTNADIPDLDGKTISNATLSNCVTSTEDIGTDPKSIANIAYVEKRFTDIENTALGALQFGGPVSDYDGAKNTLKGKTYWNHYFKVTGIFTIEAQYLYSNTESAFDQPVKPGDTLIVYPIDKEAEVSKFVYIPSGNEEETTITVTEEGSATNALDKQIGGITFEFAPVFEVSNPRGKVAKITMPAASASQPGHLSVEDYVKFSSYADNLKVVYTPTVPSNAVGVYEIGTITVGSTPSVIYGQNYKYALSVENGVGTGDAAIYNPVLKFKENGVDSLAVTYTGTNGIRVAKDASGIKITAANEVIEQDVPQPLNPRKTKYLTITNGYQFGVNIGSVDAQGNVTDGLTDYSQFNALVERVASTFETFTYSLNGSANENEYRYGNAKLKAAVTLTI